MTIEATITREPAVRGRTNIRHYCRDTSLLGRDREKQKKISITPKSLRTVCGGKNSSSPEKVKSYPDVEGKDNEDDVRGLVSGDICAASYKRDWAFLLDRKI